jgi:hypothetical protein
VVIHSGHGLQAYWLFRELWTLPRPADREQAKALCQRLQQAIQAVARAQHWHVDSTFDLARVFRLPGTYNRKAAPVPVTCLVWEPQQRYSPEEFADILPPLAADGTRGRPVEASAKAAPSLHALPLSPRLKYLLRLGEDPEDPQRYPSRSEAIFAVIMGLLAGGAPPGDILSVLLDPRYLLSAKAREQGERWLRQEIARAQHKSTPGVWHDQASSNGTVPDDPASLDATRFPFVDLTPRMPPLPAAAQCVSPGLDTWLSVYVQHSQEWAPRAAAGYHAAVGLWVLSTVAARRIVVHTGSHDVFPTLFLALIGESTLWTKTTTAAIGVRLLRRAGCGHFLSPDRTTPQFLLKLMSGVVPEGYATQDAETQEVMRKAYGFSAQRGWFYEEWGGMLHQMRRVDSPQAELNKLLIVLEGGAETFETGTIQRGLEHIDHPYLALLGNATPHDLLPFMGEGDAWWHDGFWPRFACITPPRGQDPVRTPRPRKAYTIPHELLIGLHHWDERLGSPQVTIAEITLASGKRTGEWAGTVGPRPEQAMELTGEVYDAMEAYDDALLTLSHGEHVHSDLRPWYARAKEKALRVAMLLTSVEGDTVIELPYWQEAQVIVEGWRQNLHDLVGSISVDADQTRQGMRRSRLERRVEEMLSKSGGMTAREMQQHLKGVHSTELQQILESMVKIGIIYHTDMGKKRLYLMFHEQTEQPEENADKG